MNERILQLVYRAANGMLSYDAEGEWRLSEKEVKKLAELIIRECMDLLEDYTTDVHVGGIAYNIVSAEETLQKHFGVER